MNGNKSQKKKNVPVRHHPHGRTEGGESLGFGSDKGTMKEGDRGLCSGRGTGSGRVWLVGRCESSYDLNGSRRTKS